MARRRRLVAPDENTLNALEDGFATKPLETKSMVPPIAQVAGEAAALAAMEQVTDRAALARTEADAEKYYAAQTAGLVAEHIALDDIDETHIRRDRMQENADEMAELEASLLAHGLRSPIEVVKIEEGYGLISGFRRLKAFKKLAQDQIYFEKIPAFVRPGAASADAYINMVEENEIRADLTPYERGRISVLAVGQGAFASVADAVDALFASVSKAKRSKVRSFALIHEMLGDLLQFPASLSEKNGLKLAAGLRNGNVEALRTALGADTVEDPMGEWARIDTWLSSQNDVEKRPSRGGRPSEIRRLPPRKLSDAQALQVTLSANAAKFEVKGATLTEEKAAEIADLIQAALQSDG
ncbi:ParB/RepB/Spo0J family partition protein [Halocynthiibacter sp.]|uniref:ParB/RepB/Spo0J family partition protein n=1 Tax=Halocynthiibacter sp. TaxID=1979210 RepID=UPI003C4B797A